jgi:two-component system response regulator NreC
MPYRDILTPLMERLVRLVGAPAAVQLVRTIPKLVVDSDGTVLDYDHHDPHTTARLLLERYEAVFGAVAPTLPMPEGSAGATAGGSDALDDPHMRPMRILLVDDHALVREGLVSLIAPQPDMQVVGQAGSLREALALAARLRPDLVLMDFTLPDGTGADATRAILATLPGIKIVFLTVHDDDERLFAAIAAGAVGYLLKSVRAADLLDLLRGVMRGEVALSPAIGQRILDEVARRPVAPVTVTPAAEELTKREEEIVRLIVQGHTNRQIADALHLSVRTVEYRRASVMSKLGLNSRAELVRYAAKHGLLAPMRV